MFEERLQAARAPDALLDFLNLTMRECLPSRTNRSVVPQCFQKQFNLAQGKSHIARKANQKNAVERVRRVTALAAEPGGSGKESDSFVVADGRSIDPSRTGELTDPHDLRP
jgi:hypothetical protein